MADIDTTDRRPGPLPCPQCGEKQNAFDGGFDPDEDPFGSFRCIVCGHRFSRDEYRLAVAAGQES